jgi:hypothetical protein
MESTLPQNITIECFVIDLAASEPAMKPISLCDWTKSFSHRHTWHFKFLLKFREPGSLLIIVGPLNHFDLLDQSKFAINFTEIVGGGIVEAKLINDVPAFYFYGRSFDYREPDEKFLKPELGLAIQKIIESILSRKIVLHWYDS